MIEDEEDYDVELEGDFEEFVVRLGDVIKEIPIEHKMKLPNKMIDNEVVEGVMDKIRADREIRRQEQIKVLEIREVRMAKREEKKKRMHSLVSSNKKPLNTVYFNELYSVFKGHESIIWCKQGRRELRLNIDEILIAYNGKYYQLDEFARIYDDEGGDYPIKYALQDACKEAIWKPNYRKNYNTNKDKVMDKLINTPITNE